MTDRPVPVLTPAVVAGLGTAVLDRVGEAVVGQREQLHQVLSAILAGGHVLLEDVPGLGKTLTARSFAQALGLEFRRVQFTPDLVPADITGSFVYAQASGEFQFRPGPLFAGLVLADEINRTPPKTQSALLEAMQEHQVTVEGQTFTLPDPFCVLATANPIEYEGTYSLPEAQLDRFLLRISFGYLDREDELSVLGRRLQRQQEDITVRAACDADTLRGMRAAVEQVRVDPTITTYCLDLVRATRTRPEVLVGSSPRGALALLLVARASAVLRGRDYVVPEDVKDLGEAALAHRLTLRPETWMQRVTAAQVARAVLDEVPVPSAVLPPESA